MATVLRLERTESIWPFWWRWILANMAGWAVGITLQNAVQLALEAATGGALVEAEGGAILEGIGGFIFGVVLGALQWLVLRSRTHDPFWWIAATASGFTLAGVLGGALEDAGSAAGGLVVALGLGLAAGTLQWLLLRRLARHSGWWAPANSILVFAGLLAGLAASSALTGDLPGVSATGAAFAAVGGAAYGIGSGLMLFWLLRRPHKS